MPSEKYPKTRFDTVKGTPSSLRGDGLFQPLAVTQTPAQAGAATPSASTAPLPPQQHAASETQTEEQQPPLPPAEQQPTTTTAMDTTTSTAPVQLHLLRLSLSHLQDLLQLQRGAVHNHNNHKDDL